MKLFSAFLIFEVSSHHTWICKFSFFNILKTFFLVFFFIWGLPKCLTSQINFSFRLFFRRSPHVSPCALHVTKPRCTAIKFNYLQAFEMNIWILNRMVNLCLLFQVPIFNYKIEQSIMPVRNFFLSPRISIT